MDASTWSAWAAFIGILLYGAVGIGGRAWLQYRRTGDTGLRPAPHSTAEVLGGAALVVGMGSAGVAAMGEIVGFIPRVQALATIYAHALGLVLLIAGATASIAAQLGMGSSWRIGVDPDESTDLVTGGMFEVIRNPIYSAVILAFVGTALMVPNLLAWAGLALVIVGFQVQVRFAEEPYLVRTHGDRYTSYARRVGRFVPRVGRMR